MYQANNSNQQPFNQQGQQSGQGKLLQEQDWGNLLLSELKRAAREYTTAALEASNPALGQTFQNLALKTMQDQAQLFHVLTQLGGYGAVQKASQQEAQQQWQQARHKAEQLLSNVQQSLQRTYTSAASPYQQQAEQQAYSSYQSYQQTQAYEPPYYSGNQGSQNAYGSQATNSAKSSTGYGQSYSSGYSNPAASNSGMNSGPGYRQNLTAQIPSSSAASFTHAKLAGSDITETSRGGNSFNWTDNQEDDTSSSGSTPQSSSNQTNEKSGKYIL